MRNSIPILAGLILLGLTSQSQAEIIISDAYARSARPGAPTGAAFLMIENKDGQTDQLVGVTSEIAERVELHTHIDAGDGVMQMREVEGGITIPANGMHMLKRGGDHVMFMGLNQSLETGDSVSITLEFENAGEITVEVPVDNERKAHAHNH